MAAVNPVAGDLAPDAEGALRLVEDLAPEPATPHAADDGAQADELLARLIASEDTRGTLPQLLLRTYAEIVGVLDVLRRGRGYIERVAVERLRCTHAQLREVSSATEIAATDMLDGLDRSLALVDRLDDAGERNVEAAAVRSELRDELNRLVGCLQFQDVTSQQLTHASTILAELECRLGSVLAHLDSTVPGEPPLLPGEAPPTAAYPHAASGAFDPGASTRNADRRQALADEIFSTGGGA